MHEYAVRVKSVDNGVEATFFSCLVDFTKDPPTKDYGEDNKNFNPKVFKQILSAVPADEENIGEEQTEDSGTGTTSEDNGNGEQNLPGGDDIPLIPEEDENRVVAEG